MTGHYVLCLTAALATFARLAGAAGPVVRCEACDTGALLMCKPLPKDCVERVREPGCGCCMTCALGERQACGVYTARCGSGLSCQHQPGESRPLQALLDGRGTCSGRASTKLSNLLIPRPDTNQVDGGSTNATVSMRSVQSVQSGASADTQLPIHSRLIQRNQNKRTQSYKVESVSRRTIMDIQNFSLENKREPEYGPCRREMESILSGLKISNVLNPRGFRIPNCDRRGFYNSPQCRPSKGRRRGYCWCVDKYGQPLPGSGGERGETQCNLETQ
uniref:Insulin-like growth factor-binding protein 3 n=1 Tax=Takifugu rubripes TaxID=31033 RepID=A0A674MJY5_TAKRU